MKKIDSAKSENLRNGCVIYGASMWGEITYKVLTKIWNIDEEKRLNHKFCGITDFEHSSSC